MTDGYNYHTLGHSPKSYRKKSNALAWTAFVILALGAATFAGFHYGVNGFMKTSADQKAVQSISTPVALTIPKIKRPTSGTTEDISWKDITFKDGLRCRIFSRGGTGFASSCNWASLPEE